MIYDIYQLKVKKGLFVNYTYLIVDKDTKKAAIIDPSWDCDAIIELANELNVKIGIILLTHSHIDHVYCVGELIKRLKNVKVYISQVEAEYYKYNIKGLITLKDGEVIELGKTKIKGMLTPGHTKGSMCFLLEDSLFTGDTIFQEGCGLCNTPGGDASEMYRSIQKIKGSVKLYVKVYAGHSFGRSQGERLSELSRINLYFQMNDEDVFIKFRNRTQQKDLFNFK